MSKGEKKKRNSMTWKRGKLHIGVKIPNTRCSEIFIMAFNFGLEEAVILLHSKLSHLTNLIIFYVGYQSARVNVESFSMMTILSTVFFHKRVTLIDCVSMLAHYVSITMVLSVRSSNTGPPSYWCNIPVLW